MSETYQEQLARAYKSREKRGNHVPVIAKTVQQVPVTAIVPTGPQGNPGPQGPAGTAIVGVSTIVASSGLGSFEVSAT
ncbi:hypothetical protein WHJ98_14575, partial [Staphylococcus aureus]|uniref:hypothetical protein n=1 Tax=Staphylococcus aureus TaxID=1280 RepID=UPI0039BE20AD